jgi:hypothetical protein
VPGEFVSLDEATANMGIDDGWWCGLCLRPGVATRAEPDRHWLWYHLIPSFQNRRRTFRALGLRTIHDQAIQSAAIYDINATSLLDSDKGAIYIERISSAPRNREELVPKPSYKYGALRLIHRLVLESHLLAYDGRLVLESIDVPRTKGFYSSLGFTPAGPAVQGLLPMELTPAKAHNILTALGVLP